MANGDISIKMVSMFSNQRARRISGSRSGPKLLKMSNKTNTGILVISILFVIINFTNCNDSNSKDDPESYIWNSLHYIQLYLYEYFHANNHYPERIEEVVESGCTLGLPKNVFYPGKNIEMKNIDIFGKHTQGDFSYLPVYEDNIVNGYFIVIYGDEEYFNKGGVKNRIDIDGDGILDNAIAVECRNCGSGHPVDLLAEYLDKLTKEQSDEQSDSQETQNGNQSD